MKRGRREKQFITEIGNAEGKGKKENAEGKGKEQNAEGKGKEEKDNKD